MAQNKWTSPNGKNKYQPFLTSQIKTNLKLIIDLTVANKTFKMKTQRKRFVIFEVGKDFLGHKEYDK